MASSIQILRSSIAKERPFPGNLLDGQPALNTNSEEPGLFFKVSDGTIVKFGPAAITSDGNPPNTGGVGQLGNTTGELWLDKSAITPILKIYDGAQWVNAGSGGGGGGQVTLLRWSTLATAGQTVLSGVDSSSQQLAYTAGLEELYVNGAFLRRGVDYTATNGSTINILAPLTLNDEITMLAWAPFLVGSQIVNADVDPNAGITYGKLDLAGSIVNADVNASAGIVASKLLFTQSGTNAVSRSVDSKLKDTVSVKDFGAIGDGVADDTTAMNAAATAAASQNRALFVPAGVYKMTAPWVVPIKVYVLGESPCVQPGFDPGNYWQYGSVIFKAHTGSGVTKIGAFPYNEGAPIENITISSNRFTYPGGNGFVIDKCSNVHLIRCNVFGVGGDCYQLGVTAGDVTGHNYVYSCYSNNPSGVHYRVRQKWSRFHYPVADGGTIGMLFDNAPLSEVDGFHFEGFTQVGIKISNGSTNCVFTGRGYIGHTVIGSPTIGVQITNEAGNSGCVFENIYFGANSIIGDECVQLSSAAINSTFTNCSFFNWDVAFNTSASYLNSRTTVQNCVFFNCGLPIYAAGDNTYFLNNSFDSTVGLFDINHIAGSRGLWSGNSFDKAPNPALTTVQGDYGGIKVKDNTGFVTRNRGTTGSVTAYTNIAHGLAGIPAGQLVLTSNTSGITSFPQIASLDATNFSLNWTGAANAQWNWEAALPCDY